MTQETKLGLFVLAAITCLMVSIMLLGDFQFQRRYDINVLFGDIAGLPAKAKVKIAGVDVGAVRKITLEGNKARITIWIRQDIQIHRDSRASIVATGIIGSKYLDLTMGSDSEPLLKEGDTITGINPISFDQVISTVMEKLDTVFGMFEGEDGKNMGKNLAGTIKNLKEITDTLHKALYQQEDKLSETIDNFHSFSEDMAGITSDNREDIRETIKQIKAASEKLDRVLAKVDNSQGTIGKLLTDKEMGDDLKDTFKELKEDTQQVKKVLKRINLIETDWNYVQRYDTREQYAHSDLVLKVIPSPGKYYYLGVSNVGDTASQTGDIETKNTLDLLYGRTFDGLIPVDIFGGAIRSEGGLGIRVKPLAHWAPLSRLELTAEAFNFARNVPVAKPDVILGARIKVNNWSYIGAQVEDIYNTSNLNAYLQLTFRDDDIAYILGLVGLARP